MAALLKDSFSSRGVEDAGISVDPVRLQALASQYDTALAGNLPPCTTQRDTDGVEERTVQIVHETLKIYGELACKAEASMRISSC